MIHRINIGFTLFSDLLKTALAGNGQTIHIREFAIVGPIIIIGGPASGIRKPLVKFCLPYRGHVQNEIRENVIARSADTNVWLLSEYKYKLERKRKAEKEYRRFKFKSLIKFLGFALSEF